MEFWIGPLDALFVRDKQVFVLFLLVWVSNDSGSLSFVYELPAVPESYLIEL